MFYDINLSQSYERTQDNDNAPFGDINSDLKAAYSVTMNIFRKKNIFFLNHL